MNSTKVVDTDENDTPEDKFIERMMCIVANYLAQKGG